MQFFSRCFHIISLIAISLPLQTVAADSVPWRTDIESAVREAQQENKLVLLHFWDYQSPPCRRLEKNVFPRQEVAAAIEANFIPVKINVTDAARLQRQYDIQQWPTDIILTADQQQLHRDISEQSPEAFIAVLNQIATRRTADSTAIVKSSYLQESSTTSQQSEAPSDDNRQSSFQIEDTVNSRESVNDLQQSHPSSSLGDPTIPDLESTPGQPDLSPRSTAIKGTLSDGQQIFPRPANHALITPVSNTQQEPSQPPPLGLEGFCPVTLAGRAGKFPQWQPGNP